MSKDNKAKAPCVDATGFCEEGECADRALDFAVHADQVAVSAGRTDQPSGSAERIAVFCVGNKLMLDEGIGPAVYEELQAYSISDNVTLFDVGCMSLDMLSHVRDFDFLITVDAVDGTGEEAGTVFEYEPEDMARHVGAMASLHDLKLIDLFDAASLLGYSAQGRCFGMQVENMNPAEITIGLTPSVYAALPLLVDTVLACLLEHGAVIRSRVSGQLVEPGWHHKLRVESAFE